MEFRGLFEESAVGLARDGYADPIAGWYGEEEEEEEEEVEALSLCDLVTERGDYKSAGLPVEWESTLRDSNRGSSHQTDFFFDVGRSSSPASNICAADNLFHQGRLLPLTVQRCGSESNAHFSYSKSNSRKENRLLLNEKMQAWRTDSLGLKSTYWTSFTSSNPHVSQRKDYFSSTDRNLRRGNFGSPSSNSTSRATRTSKPPPLPNKTRGKWKHFFTPGLIRTPAVKLEDLRLKQGKPGNNALDASGFKRSVSCNYEEGLMRAIKFEQKSKSVNEKTWAVESARSRGWSLLAHFKSVNSCKASNDSVKNFGTIKEPVDAGRSAEATRTPLKTQVSSADQQKLNSARASAKFAASNDKGGGRVHPDPVIVGSSAKRSRWICPKLLFRSMFTFRRS